MTVNSWVGMELKVMKQVKNHRGLLHEKDQVFHTQVWSEVRIFI